MRAEFKFVDVIISYVIYFMSNSTSCNNNSFSSNYILFVFESIFSCQLTVIRRPGVASRAGTANPLGAPESTLVF
jgi:hypothetical protein